MRKQDYLVHLIATLSANEKRYFKLFCALQPGEKRYLKLFDALENKDRYEGAELAKELGLEAWQLADDKHYLTQTLLQSLRNYDQESSEVTILRNQKENVHSLIMRRMFNFADDIIAKALPRALELEAYELVDSFLALRSSCRGNMGLYPDKDDTLDIHSNAADCLTQIIQLLELRGRARKLETRAAAPIHFDKLLKHPLLKGGVSKLKSLRAKSLWYEIKAHYYSSLLDEDALVKVATEERQLYLKNPQIKIINPIVYLTNLSRLAGNGSDYHQRQKFVEDTAKEFANPDIKLSNQRRESLAWGNDLIRLWNLRHLHRFKEALPISEKLYPRREARSEFDRISIGFEHALILLHNNKATKATDVIDELLRIKSDVRLDMQPFIRVLHIMAQLHLENYALIPHAIKSFKFWLKKRGGSNTELDTFLKHAGLIAKGPMDKRPLWLALQRDVEAGKMETINYLLQFNVWLKNIAKRSGSF